MADLPPVNRLDSPPTAGPLPMTQGIPTPEPRQPSGTVAFLFTDIEGSTKRWEAHGQAMAAAVARHDALLRRAIDDHGGHVFKTIGDAFCAAFRSPTDAVAAAVQGQRALAAEEWGEVGAIRARMALHAGEAEERDADYFGPTVNRVARLLAAGHGGQVLVSDAVRGGLAARPAGLADGLGLRDLGERRLKDLIRPERVFQLLVPGLPDVFPPLNALDARPNNLPVQPTTLVGREMELAAVKERLRRPGTRILTLTGPGGTGKTRLALQVAADLIDEFPHGVWFVDLSATTDPDLVAAAIAVALGVREEGGGSLEEQVLGYLRDKELLLVPDNFEQVLPAAGLVGRLVGSCPKLKLLVTSRAPLRLSAEGEFPVDPLPVPDPTARIAPTDLAAFPSVELFVERAAAVKPGFGLTAENARAVAGVCVALDGLPLAIELAAARVRLLPPQALLPRLERRLQLLTGGARDKAARQKSLRAAIAWSHDLLAAPEQRLFARLAVFAGGCTVEAAEAVCGSDGDAGIDLLNSLEALVEHSLVRQEERHDGQPRFRMLATIREFAAEQLEETGEAECRRRAHADHFLVMSETARGEMTGPAQIEWLDRLETEHDNFRAAIAWLLDHDVTDALRLVGSLWRFWYARGHLTEGRMWLESALGRPRPDAPRVVAEALDGVGSLSEAQGDYQHAIAYHESSLELRRSITDPGIVQTLTYLGIAERKRGNHDRATALYEQALGLAREFNDVGGTGAALGELGQVALDRGDLERADTLLQQSLDLFRTLGDTGAIGQGINCLGILAFFQGDHRKAAELYGESLELWRGLGDRRMLATALANLAEAVRYEGDLLRADTLASDALDLFRELGEKRGTAFALLQRAYAAEQQRDRVRAGGLYAECLVLGQQIGATAELAEPLEGLARLAAAQGSILDAARWVGAADGIKAAAGMPLSAEGSVGDALALSTQPDEQEAHALSVARDEGRLLPVDRVAVDAARFGQSIEPSLDAPTPIPPERTHMSPSRTTP